MNPWLLALTFSEPPDQERQFEHWAFIMYLLLVVDRDVPGRQVTLREGV